MYSLQGAGQGQYSAKYEIEVLLNMQPNSIPIVSQGQEAGVVATPVVPDYGGGYGQAAYGQAAYGQGYGQAYGADPYAAAAQQSAYGAAYGGYVAPAAAAVVPTVMPDPTAYYNDFWHYASYYGEAAARAYYQQWSPPEGTLPPNQSVPAAAATTATSANSDAPATDSTVTDNENKEANNKESNSSAETVVKNSNSESVTSEATVAGTNDAWEAYKKQVCHHVACLV